jgi:hypothetical protein
MLILAGVAFYYQDEIKTGGISLLQWIRTFRSRPGDDPNNSGNGLPTYNSESGLPDIWDRVKNLFRKDNSSPKDKFTNLDNTSVETIKLDPIASSSRSKLDSDMNFYFKDRAKDLNLKEFSDFEPNLKGQNFWGKGKAFVDPDSEQTPWEMQHEGEKLIAQAQLNDRILDTENIPEIITQITGENWLQFERESETLMAQIKKFMIKNKTDDFPDIESKAAVYSTLRGLLLSLSTSYKLYHNWAALPHIEDQIDRFIWIENDIYTNSHEERESVLSDEAIQENQQIEEVWSDRGDSPHNQLSPVNQSTPRTIHQELDPILESESEIIQDDTENLYTNYSVDELQTENYKSVLSPILTEQINQTEEWASPPVQSSPVQTPITHLPSITNLFDDTQALFDDNEDDTLVPLIENTDQSVVLDENKSSFTNLFKDIKSQRKEYGTPVLDNKSLDIPEVTSSEEIVKKDNISGFSALMEQIRGKRNETDAVEPSTSNIDPNKSPFYDDLIWDKATIEFDENLREVKVDFGDCWKHAKTVCFTTNNNHVINFDYETTWLSDGKINSIQTFDLSGRIGDINHFSNKTELKEVLIQDLGGEFHSIHKNSKFYK